MNIFSKRRKRKIYINTSSPHDNNKKEQIMKMKVHNMQQFIDMLRSIHDAMIYDNVQETFTLFSLNTDKQIKTINISISNNLSRQSTKEQNTFFIRITCEDTDMVYMQMVLDTQNSGNGKYIMWITGVKTSSCLNGNRLMLLVCEILDRISIQKAYLYDEAKIYIDGHPYNYRYLKGVSFYNKFGFHDVVKENTREKFYERQANSYRMLRHQEPKRDISTLMEDLEFLFKK